MKGEDAGFMIIFWRFILFISIFLILFLLPVMAEERNTMNDNFIPEWAKTVVWYQIFPDRFRNGDPLNDPKLENIEGSWPHDHISPWQVHPWTSDWYEFQPYEKQNKGFYIITDKSLKELKGKINIEKLLSIKGQQFSPVTLKDKLIEKGFTEADIKIIWKHTENEKTIWYDIQRQRYGGDLQGIIDKLDYLQSLGVTAIYLNPIFESPSLHKYDAIMYHHIDANFGPDSVRDRELIKKEVPHDPGTWVMTSADKLFLKLIKEVHKRKMKIIIDGVFNHIGIKNPFFQDVVKNQENSKYKDWFIVTSWNDPAKGKEFTYKGWFGVKELPEWGRTDNNLLPGPKSYIFNITKRWMDPDCDGDPSDGIDGWRLDVAFCVPHGFWKDWSKHVKSINPEAYMTAEIIDTAEVNKPYLKGDEFTAVMNYNFAFTSSEYFFDEHNRISTTEFDKRLRELREAYNKEISYVMQNLIDSHDTARMNTMIVNKDKISYRDWHKYCEYAKGSNPEYDTGKPLPNEIKRQKIFVIFQMTYLGSPMVYYGNEVGMWGATDPCCRKPMIWEDMEYSDEIYLPDGSKRSVPDKVGVNKDLFNHYKKLINIRNSHKALQLGDFNTLFIDDKNEIYGFSRKYKDEYIVVIVNNSKKEKRAKFEVELPGTFVDLLNEGNGFTVKEDKTISLDVKGEWGRILLLENK